jgi:hypothetical protein
MNRRRRVVVTEHEATNNPLSATTRLAADTIYAALINR